VIFGLPVLGIFGAGRCGILNEIRTQSITDEMPPNGATSVADSEESGDLHGFGASQGREAGTISISVNPR
jgi:hypothetical protein